ncbi:MAG TPA: ParB/RepB/Spo0J family partition protein, partial [Gammaproteobacteria bacterium]|nr:ParB/RepB/Spo0J family partition protein [Gammaproteobacteria bacterium]
MTTKRRGLGNLGVDVLLSAASSPAVSTSPIGGELRQLPIHSIQRSKYQPRIRMRPEALQELADSIRVQGLVQPVVVRPLAEDNGGTYELIAGERRWRAAQMAGLDIIPALIKPIPDQAAAAMSLIENIQRENLNPLEEASAFHRLIEEFSLTHQQVADAVGRSRAAVTNYLRLLELSEPVRQLLDEGKLEMGHARALLSLKGDQQLQAARYVVARTLSVRETERYVKALLSAQPRSVTVVRKDADVSRLERSLGDTLGARVEIHHDSKGRGIMIIHYNSLDELDGIIA